jgi:predicted nucleic acid-binding protein
MRKVVVVDTSLVLKWIINEPDSEKALALLTKWSNEGVEIHAPALLAYEATNSLYQKVRSGKYTLDGAKQSLVDVIFTELELDFSQDAALSVRALEFADRFGLQATYDPHYLALAEREGCELWTADTRMWQIVRSELTWVRWVSDYQPTDQHVSPNESDNS